MADTATNHKLTSNIGGDAAIAGGFGCNGKTAQASVTAPAVASDLATSITLLNAVRTALLANGILK